MRDSTNECVEVIKHFEGFKPKVYDDGAGYPTIGYGHKLKANEIEDYKNIAITKQQAEEILRHDMRTAESAVDRLVKSPLKDNQFDALVCFTYNLGSGALQRSTLRQRLNRGDYEVHNEFLKYVLAGGKKSKGLLRRRKAEASIFAGFGFSTNSIV